MSVKLAGWFSVVLLGGLLACGPSGRPAAEGTDPARSRPSAPADEATLGDGLGRSPDTPDTPSDDEVRVAAIERAINETRATRHECWAFAAAEEMHVEGSIVLGLTFGQGDTAAVEVVTDRPGNPRLTTCLTQLYEQYRWPAGVFAAGNRIELPFDFRIPRFQYTIKADHVEERPIRWIQGQKSGGKVTARVLIDEENTGNGAGALSLVTLTGDGSVPLHRHTRTAEIVYVLSGEVRVHGLDGARRAVRLVAGDAVYLAAGTAHAFLHQGEEPCILAQLFAPSGPQRSYRAGPPIDTVLITPAQAQAQSRGGKFPRPVFAGATARRPEVYPLPGGAATVAIYFDPALTGEGAASLGVLAADPPFTIPPHTHASESEIVLVLDGDNVATVAGDPYPLARMTALQIPPGIEHSLDVAEGSRIRALQFYTPAGPEQRFKGAPAP